MSRFTTDAESLTSAQEVAGTGVPVDGELSQAGAELHLQDARVGVAVPFGLASALKPVEVEALEDEAGLRDSPRKVVLQASHKWHHQD